MKTVFKVSPTLVIQEDKKDRLFFICHSGTPDEQCLRRRCNDAIFRQLLEGRFRELPTLITRYIHGGFLPITYHYSPGWHIKIGCVFLEAQQLRRLEKWVRRNVTLDKNKRSG